MNYFKSKTKIILSVLFIICVSVVGYKALLKDVVYESDDYLHHAGRVANYYLALKQGQMPVRWAPNLNNSYGYPSFNYMYHSPYMMSSFLHQIGFSIQLSLNLSTLFILIIGAISCFFLLRSFKLNYKWNVLLSLWFIFNPYTMLSTYWRGAIGEIWFYNLVPLLLLSIKHTIKQINNRQYLYLSATITALIINFIIISHLPSILLLIPLLIVFILYEVPKKHYKWFFIYFIFSWLIGLLLSAWYWIPAYFDQWMIMYKHSTSLQQYSSQLINTWQVLMINKNFNSSNSFTEVIQIGSISFLAIILGCLLIKQNKKIILWLALIVLSLFLLSPTSILLWNNFILLQYIQYPWRTLWLVSISGIIIFTTFLTSYKLKNKQQNYLFIFTTILLTYSIFNYRHTKGFTTRSNFEWYQTFATGSSFDEHRPIWSKTPYYFPDDLIYSNTTQNLNKENLKQKIKKLSTLNPKIVTFNGTKIEYSIISPKDIYIFHKRLFYPGWQLYLNNKKSDFIKVKQNIIPYEGVLILKLKKNIKTNVKIIFTGYTPLRQWSEITSIVTLISLILSNFFIYKQNN